MWNEPHLCTANLATFCKKQDKSNNLFAPANRPETYFTLILGKFAVLRPGPTALKKAHDQVGRPIKTYSVNKKLSLFIRQHLLLLAALYVMTFGVSLFIRSNLGSSAISVTPLVWSSAGADSTTVLGWHVPQMTVGGYTIVMNCIFVFLQILILRRRYQPYQLFQLLTAAF